MSNKDDVLSHGFQQNKRKVLGWQEGCFGYCTTAFHLFTSLIYKTFYTEFLALSVGIICASPLLNNFLRGHIEVCRKGNSERYFVSFSNWANPVSKQTGKSTMCGGRIILEKGPCNSCSRNLVLLISILKMHPEAAFLQQSRTAI